MKKLLIVLALCAMVLGVASTALADNGPMKPWVPKITGENGTIDPW